MVIEVQEDNHFTLNHVNNYSIANVDAEHAGQVMTERLADVWMDYRRSQKAPCRRDPARHDLFGEALEVLLKSGSEA